MIFRGHGRHAAGDRAEAIRNVGRANFLIQLTTAAYLRAAYLRVPGIKTKESLTMNILYQSPCFRIMDFTDTGTRITDTGSSFAMQRTRRLRSFFYVADRLFRHHR